MAGVKLRLAAVLLYFFLLVPFLEKAGARLDQVIPAKNGIGCVDVSNAALQSCCFYYSLRRPVLLNPIPRPLSTSKGKCLFPPCDVAPQDKARFTHTHNGPRPLSNGSFSHPIANHIIRTCGPIYLSRTCPIISRCG